MSSMERASLLTIPCELRNAIYAHIFDPDLPRSHPVLHNKPDELAVALRLVHRPPHQPATHNAEHAAQKLAILQTCKQIHDEAYLMALSLIPFHITGDCSYPDLFDIRSRPLCPAKIGAIRQLTLTARISHLRALNEAWANLPFGHPSLQLDQLTVVPKRPEVHATALAEIADLSQSHTLAYIFCETLKGLRNVRCVEVQNAGCFNEVVWRLFYRSLVYRLCSWGGEQCGVRFQSGEDCPGGTAVQENRWFRAYLACDDPRGSECGEEWCRLVGRTTEGPHLTLGGAASI